MPGFDLALLRGMREVAVNHGLTSTPILSWILDLKKGVKMNIKGVLMAAACGDKNRPLSGNEIFSEVLDG